MKSNFENFVKTVKEQFDATYPDMEVHIVRAVKKGNITKIGLILTKKGEEPAPEPVPAIYMEEYYEKYLTGISLESIIKEVKKEMEAYSVDHDDAKNVVALVKSWEKVSPRLYPRIISRKGNEKFLENKVNHSLLDLAVYYIIELYDNGESRATIDVQTPMLDVWGITEEELRNKAFGNLQKNRPAQIMDLGDMLNSILGGDNMSLDTEKIGTYVAMYGQAPSSTAAIMADEKVMHDFAKEHGSFYIMPSSIYELMLLPCDQPDDAKDKQLRDMIQYVNDNEVEPEDRLSYSLYYYDQKDSLIHIR